MRTETRAGLAAIGTPSQGLAGATLGVFIVLAALSLLLVEVLRRKRAQSLVPA